jgi:hypothetical protein
LVALAGEEHVLAGKSKTEKNFMSPASWMDPTTLILVNCKNYAKKEGITLADQNNTKKDQEEPN